MTGDEFSSDVEVGGVVTLLSVSCWELSTETVFSCVFAAASVKWAFRRSRLKNFSLSSFTLNLSVRAAMGIELEPFASKSLSLSTNRRFSGMVTTSLLVTWALLVTTASTVCRAGVSRLCSFVRFVIFLFLIVIKKSYTCALSLCIDRDTSV